MRRRLDCRRPQSGAKASEDGEGVAGSDFPDDLAAGLDLAVELLRQRLGLFLGAHADEDVAPAAHDALAVPFESVGELLGVVVRLALDADLPRGVPAIEHLFLPRLGLRVVVPALLGVEPVLDAEDERLDVRFFELGFDDLERLPRLQPRRRVDEDRVTVARNREPSLLQLLRELPCLRPEVEADSLEEALGALVLELDADPPVVARHCRLQATHATRDRPAEKSQNRHSRVSHASRFSSYPQKQGARGRRPLGGEKTKWTGPGI